MATKGLRLKCPILFHPFRWKATYIFVDWAVFPAHVSSRSYAVTYIHSVGNLSANAFEKMERLMLSMLTHASLDFSGNVRAIKLQEQ